MLIVGSVGLTLITLAFLENKGKLSINHTILNIILISASILGGWWGLEVLDKTLF